MSHSGFGAGYLLRLVALVGMIVLAATGARAEEERSQTDPTDARWYFGLSDTEINQLLSANNARLVSIKVQQTSPLRFTVSMVPNEGPYAKGWYWYYGQTVDSLAANLSALNARLIDLEVYYVGGEQRFAAIMVDNTGAENKAWWWYVNETTANIATFLAQNNARLIDISTYFLNGQRRYSVVMIENAGADQKAWWWYVGYGRGDIDTFLRSNDARLIALEDQFDGTYAVIMEGCPCPFWGYYYGLEASQVGAFLAQNGMRLVSIEPYLVGFPLSTLRFNVVMINNVNAETSRIGALLRAATSAPTGLYVKQVGGPVSAALQEHFNFEPASTIKALIHLRAMLDVQADTRELTDQIIRYGFTNPNTSCPSNANTQVQGTEPLSTALELMMQYSDNPRTRSSLETVGVQRVNDLAAAIGMSNTRINQTLLGCGAPPFNNLTLADIARLYEVVADGTQLSGFFRDRFYSLMAGTEMLADDGFDFPGMQQEIVKIVDQEAPFGLSASDKQAFLARLRQNSKAGGYTCITADCLNYTSIGGWAQIPFCINANVVPRAYVFGLFVNGADTVAEVDAGYGVRGELLREPLRAGLSNWAACIPTPTHTPTTVNTPTPTFTPTIIRTVTPTHTLTTGNTVTPTHTSTTVGCHGDCSGNGTVTVEELVTMVRIALDLADPSTCVAGDSDDNEVITVNELVGAVTRALSGCSPGGDEARTKEEPRLHGWHG